MAAEYKYRRRQRERELRRKRTIRIAIAGGAALILIALIVFAAVKIIGGISKGSPEDNPLATPEIKGTIEDNVYVEGVMVGGMEFEEAVNAVNAYAETLTDKTLNISAGKKAASTELTDLGVSYDVGKSVAEAFECEESGRAALDITIDDALLRSFVETECKMFNVKPKNASLTRTNGEFHVKKSKKGRTVNVDATVEAVKAALPNIKTMPSLDVEAVIDKIEPEYSENTMSKVKDVLGKYSTNFKESETDRSANLRNAVGFIDGTVLYPGERFSVAEAIYPLSEGNGYKEAPSYADGEVVKSLGGGVCQVSTTLYNAVLRAELEINERFPHSMVVTYVEPSMDAAIAGDYKDLKFTNNTDIPIYIQGSVYGGVITFTIYGEEIRPSSRTISFVPDIVERIEPGKDKVTKDKTKPEGYEKVTQSAHIGYVANLYKVTYENGVETSREKVNYSKYNPAPRHVIIGTKKKKKKVDNNTKATPAVTPVQDKPVEPPEEAPVQATEPPAAEEAPPEV